jgi:hypothetical protein
MHANDVPVVGQALSPANRIISQTLRERMPGTESGDACGHLGKSPHFYVAHPPYATPLRQ